MIDWSLPFSGRDLVQYRLVEIALVFNEAILEREQFAKVNVDFDPLDPTFSLGFASAPPAAGGDAVQFLQQLYNRIEIVATRAVRVFDDMGGAYDVTTQFVDSVLKHREWDGAVYVDTDLTFPYPNGWKRKVARDIYTLSYPGVDGQRARFVINLGSDWFAALRADPDYATTPTTPDGEKQYAGKFFDRVSGVWVLSDDQQSDMDILTEQITGLDSHTWIPRFGDIVDEDALNDLRDAIKQTVKFWAGATGVGDVIPTPVAVAGGPGDGGPTSWIVVQSKHAVNYIDLPSAQSDYDAYPADAFFDLGPEGDLDSPNTYTFGEDSGAFGIGWGAGSGEAKPQPALDPADTTLIAKVKTYHKASAFELGGPGRGVFDAYGDGVVNAGGTGMDAPWHQVGGELTQLVTDPGPLIGSLKATSPVPWYHDDLTVVVQISGGWTTSGTVMIFDMRVAGGFKYT